MHNVAGAVTPSDSRDMTGVEVNISLNGGIPQTAVVAGNTFNLEYSPRPKVTAPVNISATYADQATYGTAYSTGGPIICDG